VRKNVVIAAVCTSLIVVITKNRGTVASQTVAKQARLKVSENGCRKTLIVSATRRMFSGFSNGAGNTLAIAKEDKTNPHYKKALMRYKIS